MKRIESPVCFTSLKETHSNLTMIMCPHAGVGLGAFRQWRHITSPTINLLMVTYPGRDHRMDTPLLRDIAAIANEVATSLQDHFFKSRRLILVGHSMGAQIAFETCQRLEESGNPPDLLVISGCHAPHRKSRTRLSNLEDTAFLEGVIAIGGCNDNVKNNPSILDIFLPLLRADFAATETYERDDIKKIIRTPTVLISGRADKEASPEEVMTWKPWLHQLVTSIELPGDHFYPTRDPERFLSRIVTAHADCVACEREAFHD